MTIKKSAKGVVQNAGFRAVLYGGTGTGKTTLAAGAPDAVVLSGEGGDGQIACSRVVFEEITTLDPLTGKPRKVERHIPKDWAEIISKLAEIDRSGLGARTLVLDGFGAIEGLCVDHVLGTATDDKGRRLQNLNAGWGAGDGVLLSKMREAWVHIESIWLRQGVNIIMTCHERMTRGTDERGEYTRRAPALNSASKGDVAGWLAGWADFVGLVELETVAAKIGERGGDSVFTRRPTGRRLLRLAPTDGYVAKCRFAGVEPTIALPPTTPSAAFPTAHPGAPWQAFWSQVEAGPLDAAKVRAEFDAELAELARTDAERAAKGAAWRDAPERTPRDFWLWTRAEREKRSASTAAKAA